MFRKCASLKLQPVLIKINRQSSSLKRELPVNVLESSTTSHLQKENGVIFDKKPFKIHLDKEKKYSWCLCGKSKNQPFCDGTHKSIYLKITLK